MKMPNISGVPSLRTARHEWLLLGGYVEDIWRTGEERYTHPAFDRPITVNKRRRDASKKLLSALRRLVDMRHAA